MSFNSAYTPSNSAKLLSFPVPVFFLSLFLSVAVFAGDSSSDQLQAYDKHYPEVAYSELRKTIDAGEVFIIDANSADSYNGGHLPTAAPLSDREKLERHLPVTKSYPIVVYCGGPQCTAWHKAADYAAARGFTNVRHYKGGLKDWQAQGDNLSRSTE